jgi:hypothetical protein
MIFFYPFPSLLQFHYQIQDQSCEHRSWYLRFSHGILGLGSECEVPLELHHVAVGPKYIHKIRNSVDES